MTLDRLELLQLRAADGLATPEELAELCAAGVDPEAWKELKVLLTELLTPSETPDLAGDVMAAIGQPDPLAGHLRELLAPPEVPDFAGDVMAAIGLEQAEAWDLHEALRDALTPSETPDLVDAVMAAIGGEAAPTAGREEAVDNLVPFRRPLPAVPNRTARRGWGLLGAGLAAAAALLVLFAGPPATDGKVLAFQISPVNHVEIENLSAADDAMVQVLQFDQGAPTIIFIDEPDSAGDQAPAGMGAKG